MFIIDRNIPLPSNFIDHKSTVSAINVGESYEIKLTLNTLPSVYNAFKAAGKRCTVRKQRAGVYRVWRIA